jgi:hypothetical protein
MPFFSSIVVIVALVTLRKISNSASLIACLAWFQIFLSQLPTRSTASRMSSALPA